MQEKKNESHKDWEEQSKTIFIQTRFTDIENKLVATKRDSEE